jgi:hypothetical protein
MQFTSANPSVIRSVKQRDLLNNWLRARVKPGALPALADFRPNRIADELMDMMRFDVAGSGDDARFLITQEGARLATMYGSEHVEPEHRTNRYLDDAIGPERYARVVTLYRTCLTQTRPTYSISMVQDPDGKDVQYERLLLPFGRADRVEQIVGSYKAISIEGRFEIRNLLGIRPRAVQNILVRAVIDQDAVVNSAAHLPSDDLIELS